MVHSLAKSLRERARHSLFLQVMAFLGRRLGPYLAAAATFSATLALCFNNVLAFLMKDVIDAAVQGNRGLLLHALTLVAVTFFGGLPVLVLSHYVVSWCSRHAVADLRVRLFHHLADLPLGRFEGLHSGDLVSRATNDMARLNDLYLGQFVNVFTGLCFGVFSMGAIFALDWRLGWVVLALGCATAAVHAIFARPMRQASDRLQQRTGTLTERLVDLLQSLPVTRMFGLAGVIHGDYAHASAGAAEAAVAQGDVGGANAAVGAALEGWRTFGVLALGLYFYAQGQMPLGSVWAVVALQGNADVMFSELGQYNVAVQQSLAAIARVLEVLRWSAEPECAAEATTALPAVVRAAPVLTFHEVGFTYPGETGSPNAALQGVNLELSSGQMVAVVGPSGAGKSTLVKLLLGFYAEQMGEISIDGVPVRTIPLAKLRGMIAYVPQDAYLFEGTIEENILAGRPESSHDQVVAAAQAANAHGFILEQPEAYQTRVGERGARLSGGQRQRVAIARALLKDAPILLLDEATSALDSESEQLVQDALATLVRGRTTLAIAHRLSTVEHADTIYVMDGGTIVECGTHAQLLARQGLYARLYALQFTANGAVAS